jgi:hypothetical protein
MGTAAPSPDVERLAVRLAELAAVTPLLNRMSPDRVRGHVASVRRYLHDEVLAQAHREELRVVPALCHAGGGCEAATLAVEHDTVRLAAAELDGMAQRAVTPDTVAALSGLLYGIEALLGGHLRHEAGADPDLTTTRP